MTDPYQPIESKLRLTRGCLEVFADLRNPVSLITKSQRVVEDLETLAELARFDAVHVVLSVTTLDPEMARRMEPRAAHPRARIEAIEKLAAAGVPVGVNVAPVIPGLTDHEIPAILEAAAEAGADSAAFLMLRLPGGVADLFVEWLERWFPQRKEKVLRRLREMRGGGLDDSRFGIRMRGEGPYAAQIHDLFELSLRRSGLARRPASLDSSAFRRPGGTQGDLFESS